VGYYEKWVFVFFHFFFCFGVLRFFLLLSSFKRFFRGFWGFTSFLVCFGRYAISFLLFLGFVDFC